MAASGFYHAVGVEHLPFSLVSSGGSSFPWLFPGVISGMGGQERVGGGPKKGRVWCAWSVGSWVGWDPAAEGT